LKNKFNIIYLVFIILFFYILSGKSFAFKVKVSPVGITAWTKTVEIFGITKTIEKAVLEAPTGGRAMGPFLPLGNVKAGKVIAKILPAGFRQKLYYASREVKYSLQNLLNTKKLYNQRIDTIQDLNKAELLFDKAKSYLKSLKSVLNEYSIFAPFSGTLDYLVPENTYVAAGTPVAHLNGNGQLWVRGYITPSYANILHTGDEAMIKGETWRGIGRIASIGKSANYSGLVPLYISLPKGLNLIPGEWLKIKIRLKSRESFCVPTAALVGRGFSTFVFAVNSGVVKKIPVNIITIDKDKAWVNGKLYKNELVVISGADRLINGTKVEIIK
jgi:RND family efflux transporter MFP subunit